MANSSNYERLFIAVDIPDKLHGEIASLQAQLKALMLFEGTFSKPDQAHCTLCFLGKTPENEIGSIIEELDSLKYGSFVAELGALNYFKDKGTVSLIYREISAPELEPLARAVFDLTKQWHGNQSYQFKPHVTLARVKTVKNDNLLKKALSGLPVPRHQFTVNHFSLKSSTLTPDGSVYTTLEKFIFTL